MKAVTLLSSIFLVLAGSGCNAMSRVMNPFYEAPSEVALLGEKNDAALNNEGGTGKAAQARQALEAMATYQRAHAPQPNNPVMQPAVVRLMWVPDHLNSHGDLVPAHYYYLKVKREQWAVSDAFELEAQLGSSTGNASSIGYVNPEDLR
ncbi:MAG: TraV family lipoprotein [Pseudomonadota bacterium]|jgi:hypothetical protein